MNPQIAKWRFHNRRGRGRRIPTTNWNAALSANRRKAQDLRDAIRTARTGPCLIPQNHIDGECSDQLNNCHLIGVNHLKLIATHGHVYEWDMTDVVHVSETLIKTGAIDPDSPDIRIDWIEPANLNTKKCTRRLACQNHDGPVFRQIDEQRLNPTNPEHQFLMGFRAIAGSLSLCESLLDFLASDEGQSGGRTYWAERGMLEAIEELSAKRAEPLRLRRKSIRDEMTKWQELYNSREHRGEGIISSLRVFTPKIRVACSSIYYGYRNQPVALTIVPSQEDGKATMIATARRAHGWGARLNPFTLEESTLSRVCLHITDMLGNQPGEGIRHLSLNTLHFVANKADYDNTDILSAEERELIAKSIGANFAP